jgi:parallel beta-helix repeat protein
VIGRAGVTVVLIVLVLVSPYFVLLELTISHIYDSGSNEPSYHEISEVEYSPAIDIRSDVELAEYGWPGNGTESSPYLISDLRFNSDDYAILSIEDTQAYFVISNCVFEPIEIGAVYGFTFGIRLVNLSNGVVEKCTINNAAHGLVVGSANNTVIRNNVVRNCEMAIDIGGPGKIIIFNNSIYTSDYGIHVSDLSNCSITENLIVECQTGIVLDNCINNTFSLNRIGWCTEVYAIEYDSGNKWDGNYWSNWDGFGPYLISGSPGSLDESPTLFDEDVLGPTFEYYRYNGVTADLVNPLTSFTFAVNVSDASAVDTIILYIRGIEWTNTSLTDPDGEPHQIGVIYWIPYIMEHQPNEGNHDRFIYTFECNRSFSATYFFWANDTLGYSRRSDIDSFSLGCCMGSPPVSNVIFTFTLILFGGVVILILVRRFR